MGFEVDYAIYLEAKETVDDRALSPAVFESLSEWLVEYSKRSPVLKLLEVGGGVGTMASRLSRHGLLQHFTEVRYDLVDTKESNLKTAVSYLREHVCKDLDVVSTGCDDQAGEESGPTLLSIQSHFTEVVSESIRSVSFVLDNTSVRVNLICADGVAFASQAAEQYDVVVAAAFLDLVDPNNAVPKMLAAVRDGGAIYLPINFDGMTHFGPSTDTNVGNFDDIVIERFHAAMGTTATGALHNRTGRLLLSYILALSGVELRRVGSSSWTVVPTRGNYVANEKYFLHSILTFVEETLLLDETIDREQFARYMRSRRSQVEMGQLSYIAHNVDYFAVKKIEGSDHIDTAASL